MVAFIIRTNNLPIYPKSADHYLVEN